MPIRWRLTIWFALILCGILLVSGTVLYILLQSYLDAQVDNNLRIYAARIHGTLNPVEIPQPLDYEVIHSRLPPINEFASPGIYIQLTEKSGNVVVKSNNLGNQELPVDFVLVSEGLSGKTAIGTVAAGGGSRVRILISPLYLGEKVLLLEVAQSFNHVDATMAQMRLALLISILVALALSTVFGNAMVRGVLSPVNKILQTVKNIETSSDLGRRVGYFGPKDEIGELAVTFDHMIEHLDKAFRSQRYFVADASHELRGPLTVIRGNLDLLKRNISEADKMEALQAMGRESIRMSKIIDDLLFLAEVESGEPLKCQDVSLKGILAEEAERAKNIAGRRKIILKKQQDVFVKGDAQRLRQLLANLVDNAIKYTPEDGTIVLSLFRDRDWVQLDVTDTGIGIASEHLPHLFDRFYRVDKARSRASGGTGLGLAIVKGIAEQHGGKITVTSKPGEGSSFTAWFKV
ncbi:MAG: ATP-binding protein [Dehalococcoidales bacterium]|nr:ATP-binding protein [Dehalococcoidales bacterium]